MAECKNQNGMKEKHKPASCSLGQAQDPFSTLCNLLQILDAIEDMMNIDSINKDKVSCTQIDTYDNRLTKYKFVFSFFLRLPYAALHIHNEVTQPSIQFLAFVQKKIQKFECHVNPLQHFHRNLPFSNWLLTKCFLSRIYQIWKNQVCIKKFVL